MGQAMISIRVDENLKKDFDKLCNEFGVSNTAAFTIFMKAVVREKRIPFEIKAGNDFDARAKGIESFERMRQIASEKGLTGMSLDEINEEIRLARRGE